VIAGGDCVAGTGWQGVQPGGQRHLHAQRHLEEHGRQRAARGGRCGGPRTATRETKQVRRVGP
jgi:hypothetical protein